MICDCLPIPVVGVLLSEFLVKSLGPNFHTRIDTFFFLPTGRLVVGRDAPAQGKESGFINFSGGQSGRPD
jgi:hypothetical protein